VKLFNYNNEELTVKVQNLTTLYKRIYLIFYLLKNNIKPLEHYTLITLGSHNNYRYNETPQNLPLRKPDSSENQTFSFSPEFSPIYLSKIFL
jgi:hypothetical protein